MKVVSERLGHSTTVITADLYTHVIPSVSRKAADQIGSLISGLATEEPEQAGRDVSAALASEDPEASAERRWPRIKPRSEGVGPVGLEPTTRGLKVRCSAN